MADYVMKLKIVPAPTCDGRRGRAKLSVQNKAAVVNGLRNDAQQAKIRKYGK